MNRASRGGLPALIFLFVLLALWQLGAMEVNAAYILPTPLQILRRLWELRGLRRWCWTRGAVRATIPPVSGRPFWR